MSNHRTGCGEQRRVRCPTRGHRLGAVRQVLPESRPAIGSNETWSQVSGRGRRRGTRVASEPRNCAQMILRPRKRRSITHPHATAKLCEGNRMREPRLVMGLSRLIISTVGILPATRLPDGYRSSLPGTLGTSHRSRTRWSLAFPAAFPRQACARTGVCRRPEGWA